MQETQVLTPGSAMDREVGIFIHGVKESDKTATEHTRPLKSLSFILNGWYLPGSSMSLYFSIFHLFDFIRFCNYFLGQNSRSVVWFSVMFIQLWPKRKFYFSNYFLFSSYFLFIAVAFLKIRSHKSLWRLKYVTLSKDYI